MWIIFNVFICKYCFLVSVVILYMLIVLERFNFLCKVCIISLFSFLILYCFDMNSKVESIGVWFWSGVVRERV